MKVLELFAGTRSIGKAFERKGHDVTSYDWDPAFKDSCVSRDCYTIPLDELKQYDVIWASPDCTTYSIASARAHRTLTDWGEYMAVSDYAKFCDKGNVELMRNLRLCAKDGIAYFVENPRGMMRKMPFMEGMPRYTVTYCQYGDTRQKPTDIWTNCTNATFKPMCKPGAACHVAAPRGSKCGTQGLKNHYDRSVIPSQLCDRIVEIVEEWQQIKNNL